MQAHARQALQFDTKKGDSLIFLEKFTKLVEDRENRPYLDVLNHQMALFYDKQNKNSAAKKYYNKSLKAKSQDDYLVASNYRNFAEMYFREAKYKTASSYYDSTLVKLNDKSREFRRIKKKRDNLDDVIKYEGIAQQNDSILSVAAMNDSERKQYYEKYIEKLKIEDEKKAKLAAEKEAKEANVLANQNASNLPKFGGATTNFALANDDINVSRDDFNVSKEKGLSSLPAEQNGNSNNSNFYFYNPTTVEFGKKEFAGKWGKRTLKDNWKWSSEKGANSNLDATEDETIEEDTTKDKKDELAANPLYDVANYLKQIPTDTKVLDSLAKDRNFAYYQLGLIYKEKFRENELAAARLEQLLKNNPEERLVLPAKYNLYKIFQEINPSKAAAMKEQILSEYPNSRYAEIVKNPSIEITDDSNPNAVYYTVFKKFEKNQIREVSFEIEEMINRFTGDEAVAKFELLKAKIVGRLQGLDEYKKALNFVALTYPNIEEGKQAENLLKTDIPKLEALDFGKTEPTEWKIIFPKKFPYDQEVKNLTDKIGQYLKDSNTTLLKTSDDIYSISDNFIVIHGFSTKENANAVLSLLKEYKNYKIKDQAYIISTEDYKIVQIKKKIEEWLILNKK